MVAKSQNSFSEKLLGFYEEHGKEIDQIVTKKANEFAEVGDRKKLELLTATLAGMVVLLNSKLERIPVVTEFNPGDYLRMD
jgi:surface polysaccharide O-acyltransferase-like enzyme